MELGAGPECGLLRTTAPGLVASGELVALVHPPIIHRALDLAPERLAPIIGSWPEPALLESGPGSGQAGRWSLLAARPRMVFEATGTAWTLRTDAGAQESGEGDILGRLAAWLDQFGLADPSEMPDPDRPPFQGGAIGYFGYDLAPRLERVPRKAPRDSRLPDIRLALYDTAVTIDHASGAVELWAHDLLGEGATAAERRCRDWRRALAEAGPAAGRGSQLGPLESNFSREGYRAAVGRVLEYIAAGDLFQANLSQRFAARGRPAPLDLYLRLKRQSPAPFAAFLRWDDLAVVGASPEWFYRTRGDRLVTRPIKGTRPRGRDRAEDERLADELRRSRKDRAELTMIVDLERNDLGRVCRFGSVRVIDPVTVESFAQVHHLVATVAGDIRPGLGPIDILRAVFPGGSITGAPKVRAMEIIDELEPTRRSLYTGAIGYFSRGGASGFNIAIRTMLVEGDRVSFQVGGGIVADSDPEAEYLETLHKGRGLRAVIEGVDR
ncbi:MAG TPA: aminodeoxychorismate synthase component I [Isosphaeraceae bacterium]|nr:aminodeoxychorismate synthase component I [Isosphaeraceae bacterium]